MNIELKETKQIEYSVIKYFYKVEPALNNLLPKDNRIEVENIEGSNTNLSRYELLKENIKALGVTDPISITSLPNNPNKKIVIDGMTRLKIIKELASEGLINEDDLILTVNDYNGFMRLEDIADWMWERNQSTRGFLNKPKLNNIFIGRKYNSSKKEKGGNRGNQYTEGLLPKGKIYLLPTSKELSNEYQLSEKTIRNYGQLAEALELLAAKYGKPFNYFYPLYAEYNITLKRLITISKCDEESLDKKIKDNLDNLSKLNSAIGLYQTEKEREEARRKVEERRRAELLLRFNNKEVDLIMGGRTQKDIYALRKLITKTKTKGINVEGMYCELNNKNYEEFIRQVEKMMTPSLSQNLKPSIKLNATLSESRRATVEGRRAKIQTTKSFTPSTTPSPSPSPNPTDTNSSRLKKVLEIKTLLDRVSDLMYNDPVFEPLQPKLEIIYNHVTSIIYD